MVLDDAGMHGTVNASFLFNGVPTVAAGNSTCVRQ